MQDGHCTETRAKHGGMSRAAKKRAKKRQKLVEAPTVPRKKQQDDMAQEKTQKLKAERDSLKINPLSAASRIERCHSLLSLLSDQQPQNETTGLASQERATAVVQLILGDQLSVNDFYDKYWEKQPLVVQKEAGDRHHSHRFDGLLSMNSIRDTIQHQPVYYGRDLNVTRYQVGHDGVMRRVNMEPSRHNDNKDNFARVDPQTLWEHYQQQGCTVRLLCPQKHANNVHALLSLLEVEWGCMVGSNAYLTPPGHAQGFAPHYDDIEAFCLQLEGRKRWKVYEPQAQVLPRASSEDYTEQDLRGVEPVLDVVLESGDLLYMPRGWIHQACTLPTAEADKQEGHSLHLTVSTMQQWAWADLMEMLLPEALDAAIRSDGSTILRTGLPRRFLDYMGAMHDNRNENVPEVLQKAAAMAEQGQGSGDDERAKRTVALQEDFRAETKKRIMRVAKEAMNILDATCDQMGKRFMSERLPPAWTENEKALMEEGKKILPNQLIRLARPGVARMVLEDNKAVLYHCGDNSLVYQENPLSPMEFELDDAPAIEQLLTTVEPHWICVSDLIHDSIEDKVSVAQALYDEGILAVH